MRFWHASNWKLDGEYLILPNGHRLHLLHDIRRWRNDLVDGNVDLPGQWSGWRIRQQFLIPPGSSIHRTRLTARYLKSMLHWDTRPEMSRRQLELF
jgi:hypothetical protein